MQERGAGRRMLLICACLVVAMVAIQLDQIGLGSGMTAPLVSALVGIALAGVLLAWALKTSKAKARAGGRSDDVPSLRGTTANPGHVNVRVTCDPRLDAHLAGIAGELNQVERLVSDAVGNLVASFKFISKLTRSQQEISQAIVDAAAPGDRAFLKPLLERQRAIVDQVGQEMDAAVTSLQFGDLVSQLLGHTVGRVAAVDAAVQCMGKWYGEEISCERCRSGGFHRRLTGTDAASLRKPVIQYGMQKGGVELF